MALSFYVQGNLVTCRSETQTIYLLVYILRMIIRQVVRKQLIIPGPVSTVRWVHMASTLHVVLGSPTCMWGGYHFATMTYDLVSYTLSLMCPCTIRRAWQISYYINTIIYSKYTMSYHNIKTFLSLRKPLCCHM